MESIPICMEIDSDKIDSEIFAVYLRVTRAAALHTARSGGGDAAGLLIKTAVENIRRDEALFELFAHLTGREKVGFEILKKEYESENLRRRTKLSKGETVYGVSGFSLAEYIRYVTDNMKASVRDALRMSGAFAADDSALEEFYKAVCNEDPLFKDENGNIRPFSDVRAKVVFLYEENVFIQRLDGIMQNQTTEIQSDTVREAVNKILNY